MNDENADTVTRVTNEIVAALDRLLDNPRFDSRIAAQVLMQRAGGLLMMLCSTGNYPRPLAVRQLLEVAQTVAFATVEDVEIQHNDAQGNPLVPKGRLNS
jgi:hypothetical protein